MPSPSNNDHESIEAADKNHVWHPFTPMREWLEDDHHPFFIERGEGALLYDREGKAYLDGNSTIWTNVHGHAHPKINAAIQSQLNRIAHVSGLGFANEPAALLAKKLAQIAPGHGHDHSLNRVFFSDNGSTAIECALKMAIQFHQIQGAPERCEFLAFDGAYHGDTTGATALGGIGKFHSRFSNLGMQVHHLSRMSDLAKMDRTDHLALAVIEPLIQGAAGMKVWPKGMLTELRQWCTEHNVLLLLDEVMTGFGRTGTLFACEQENVVPDFLALAKGLTGGYLPLAATLTSERIFEAFLNEPQAPTDHTFYYGHSFNGNPLGCAAALANLKIFEEEDTLLHLQPKIAVMAEQLETMSTLPQIAAVRQCGWISAMDLCQEDGTPFHASARMGATVCLAAREFGILTRPIGDTLVLMPPLCTTIEQLRDGFAALRNAIERECSP